jgi:flagellar biosynthetic protein FlhB
MRYHYPVNLQFFAQEKTEKATPKKKQESRNKGQVAKSQDVATAMIMLGVFLALFFIGGWMTSIFLSLFKKSFMEYMLWEISIENVSTVFQQVTMEAAKAVIPVMTVALVAGVFANYIQVGFLFTTEPLIMKLDKIDPIQGFKRIFSVRAIVEMLKSIFKISFVSVVVYSVLYTRKEEIFLLSQKSLGDALALISTLTFQIGLIVSIILLFISILDYLYQKYDFEKNIKMSKQDVKDEYKKTEGDPLIKGKIKERQRQMAMKRMMQEVPKADVIITNPTHFAVALKYNAEVMIAPEVIAKGVDQVALKIKEIAKEHEIMTVENKPLARALYHQVEIGEGVPEDLFKAVAEVLAYVYKIKGKT